MKRISILLIFALFCNAAAAQVLLNGSEGRSDIRSFDSTGLKASDMVYISADSTRIFVLSASDTALMAGIDSASFNKQSCVIGFIGCDEEHRYTSAFMTYFYSEYFKQTDYSAAFFNAKKYLFNKYPNSPVTPVLTCQK